MTTRQRIRFVASTFSSKWWRQGKEYDGKHNTGKRALPMRERYQWRDVVTPRGRKMMEAIP